MRLYHVGYQEIPEPDIHHGRKNADFGQGFYLTADRAFGERWAKPSRGMLPHVNIYDLQTEGLKIRYLERDAEWFSYIYGNRHLEPDILADYDVIIGPIANDTIYDVLGITTSGILSREDSLQLLLIGPLYRQITIKTEKAASQLTFLSAEVLAPEQTDAYKDILRKEQEEFQALFAEKMLEIMGGD